MGRRPTVALPSLLVLACAVSSAWAGKKPFSINDDILAYPQYQVLFPDEYVLESQAEELLESQTSAEASSSSNANNNPQVYTSPNHADNTRGHDHNGPTYTYEEMILDDRRLLCQIPRVTTDEHNTTAGNSADSKAEEQKELARATDRGLELLREMEGKCMYYFSGWWSYSFCYRKQIKQFHALPAGRGIPHYPPIEDPTTHSFILGQFSVETSDNMKQDEEPQTPNPNTDMAELHTKGGSRYLVQHLRGGTKCDLTGRDRNVEVQFHCHPQSTDHIGWIKELTTCSYLMVIYTPRLCDDVAFLPPQQDEVHNIECREVLMPDEIAEWESVKEWHLTHQLADEAAGPEETPIIGGIKVGGQHLVGMEGKQIEKGRVASAGEERVEVVAKRENGEVRRMSKQILKKYDLDPAKVEDMKKRLEEMAEGKDWTLEVVENNGVVKFQGIVDSDEEEEENADATPQKPQDDKAPEDQDTTKAKSEAPADSTDTSDQEPGSEEGSEETFVKDEL
ncbi:hypothetical protein NUU61_000319 [Penicillium alfredii]|uniref:Endoplasmic reticulum lectin n=1 Tax=Penicillium alfredii TaxID=1506179 RepID=A0A9W9GAR8_9EURO|nr:uncharacterized protein NUU61_000319 [Penicillium alfredii]KAJ5114560.1 hypothetical protein NUU61_000319 [Penicillium alfredii]